MSCCSPQGLVEIDGQSNMKLKKEEEGREIGRKFSKVKGVKEFGGKEFLEEEVYCDGL